MSALDDLEKYRKLKREKFEKVANKAEETAKGKDSSGYDDDRFWKPKIGQDGNGFAIIRFLPERPEEDYPWVSYFSHGFKGPTGKWYIEKCRTSLPLNQPGRSEPDPVADYNNKLWATEVKVNQNQARNQKRRLHYISNILVVKDPASPENEGKVFLYRYGKKIYDRINALMNPEYAGEERQDPFDLETGRNFKLKIKTVVSGPNKFPNYDDSEWMSPTPIADTDEALADVLSKVYSLVEFVDPKSFKSYSELKGRLDEVMGFDTSNLPSSEDDLSAVEKELPELPQRTVENVSLESETEEESESPFKNDDDDNDDLMKRLEELAKN